MWRGVGVTEAFVPDLLLPLRHINVFVSFIGIHNHLALLLPVEERKTDGVCVADIKTEKK